MSALEKEIMNKVHQLDETQEQSVLEFVENLATVPFDYDSWFDQVEQFQAQLRAKYGEAYYVGSLSLLDELRKEN